MLATYRAIILHESDEDLSRNVPSNKWGTDKRVGYTLSDGWMEVVERVIKRGEDENRDTSLLRIWDN